MAKKLYCCIALFFLAGLISCSKGDAETPTVAQWKTITLAEDVFKSQYVRLSSSAPIRDSYEQRKRYARTLLERNIVADYAKQFGYDTIETIQQSIQRTKELAAMKYYIREQVEPRLSETTEQEIYDAFLRKNASVKLEQIYAPTFDQIEQYSQKLSGDSSLFQSMAQQSMIEAGEQPNQYLMGWVGWNQMDLSPEKTAFSLAIGEISEPVQSLSGWHIFRVVDKQETFFADQTTFQNSREVIEQELDRRKFEEESIRYINSVLEETPIEFYPAKINEFWEYLESRLPSDQQQLVGLLNSEVMLNQVFSNPENHILAQLNGEPISSQDILDRLPTIPYWQLNQNLRPALETVAKDMLFAQRAMEAGYVDDPEVQKETSIEEVRQLYNYFAADVADTLNLSRLEDEWYIKHKDRYVSDTELSINTYSFDTEQNAREALKAFQSGLDWSTVLSQSEQIMVSDSRRLIRSENSNHPAFSIQYRPSTTDNSTQLWGPYQLESGWAFIEIIERADQYFSREEISARLKADMRANIPSITHYFLLEQAGYKADEVVFNQQLLNEVLPYHFEN